jgi:hypothetical protein
MKNLDHEKLRKAKDPSCSIQELHALLALDDEAINTAIALNRAANRDVLSKLASLDSEKVQQGLAERYNDYPPLYGLAMREVLISDADYVFGLRVNDGYNQYISKVSNEVSDQVAYIKKYLSSSARSSFYFIIENKERNVRCGTVRLYNFNGDSFEWGSWILDDNKTRYAAMETAIFVYEFALLNLGFARSEFEVNKQNEKVVSYHLKSGAKIIADDDVNFYFRIEKEVGLRFAATLREQLSDSPRPPKIV